MAAFPIASTLFIHKCKIPALTKGTVASFGHQGICYHCIYVRKLIRNADSLN